MKKYVKNFFVRGTLYAWTGPIILSIILALLQYFGVIKEVSVNDVVLGIVSTTILAFLNAGVSVVYQIEKLPEFFATLIHMLVIYIDCLIVYLLNGWIAFDKILFFTVLFIAIYLIIWICTYIYKKLMVNKVNQKLNKE